MHGPDSVFQAVLHTRRDLGGLAFLDQTIKSVKIRIQVNFLVTRGQILEVQAQVHIMDGLASMQSMFLAVLRGAVHQP